MAIDYSKFDVNWDAIKRSEKRLASQKRIGQADVRPTTSISKSPKSRKDIEEAHDLLALSPEQLYGFEEEKDVGGVSEKTYPYRPYVAGEPGREGSKGFGIGKFRIGARDPVESSLAYSPQFEAKRGRAKEFVSDPYKTSTRQSGKFLGSPAGTAGVQEDSLYQEDEIYAKKPQDIKPEDWKAASHEERVEYLEQAGLL